MFLLGYDIGSSSVKASLVEIETGICRASAFFPKKEMPIQAKQSGWAEQDPEQWWENLKLATRRYWKNQEPKYRHQSHRHLLPDAWTGVH